MAVYKSLVKKVSIAPNKKTKQKEYLTKGKLPIIDQGKELIGGYSDDMTKKIICNLPVIVFGDHTKAVKLILFPFGAGADGIKVLEPKEGINPKYLYYGTQYLTYRIEDKGYARHYQYIEKKNLPVPALPQQERIVARIEELFSQLDSGVETLKKTKQQLVVYRQAVLKEAFEGNFTTCEKSWRFLSIMDVCANIVDCPHSTPKWAKAGKLCLRTTNFRRGYLDLSEKNFVSAEVYNERIARLKPEPGDVLFSREGAILGIACIIPAYTEVCLGQRMMLLRVNEIVNNKFLMYFLNSPRTNALVSENIGGSASPHINVGDIKKFKIPVPSTDIQEKVVGEIESRLSVCESIEQTVEAALQQAEAIRQSILKQAFEGRMM